MGWIWPAELLQPACQNTSEPGTLGVWPVTGLACRIIWGPEPLWTWPWVAGGQVRAVPIQPLIASLLLDPLLLVPPPTQQAATWPAGTCPTATAVATDSTPFPRPDPACEEPHGLDLTWSTL